MGTRFHDPTADHSLYALAHQPIDVVCPRCAAHAQVVAAPSGHDRRLVCPACSHTRTWSSRTDSSRWSGLVDPFFRRPLWLTTTVRGHGLWAYNRAHLDLLTEFVAASLRERGPGGGCSMSLIEKLPPWMKSARNRPDLLAALTRLRARLDADPSRSR
ncbi:ribosomal protein S27AE [Actinoplanes octamycinicus]|uniref:Ribosomal protein S27AE n=1 Tax=Actinoplanes octamycinicus TaxID=135948 RepID=A0A7W7H023_9ACTN|nr:TFIIB-type zinc ribbon-containing protein [Actinoplanes octamycinicus]MBB4741490.1 ribosomal protein S27AE [Actinoplanes octamycinicus]